MFFSPSNEDKVINSDSTSHLDVAKSCMYLVHINRVPEAILLNKNFMAKFSLSVVTDRENGLQQLNGQSMTKDTYSNSAGTLSSVANFKKTEL